MELLVTGRMLAGLRAGTARLQGGSNVPCKSPSVSQGFRELGERLAVSGTDIFGLLG